MNHSDSSFRRKARRRGFSLIEVFFVAAISVVVVAGLMASFVFVLRSFRAIQNYDALNAASRNTLDAMNRDIRAAAGVTAATGAILSMTNYDTSGFTYQWDQAAGTVTRSFTNTLGTLSTRVLLTGCDTFGFVYSIKVPGNNLTFTNTTAIDQIKLVKVSWRCSRQIYGFKINTESVQTAQIVRRN